MRLPILDDRLARAAALFPACAYGADIGADHGRLSCTLLANGTCRRMCVADISADSLAKAKKLLTLHGFSDRADFAVGDGLLVLPREAQAIAILGMGGRTISQILLSGAHMLNGAALILSAHTEVPLLRQTVQEIGYRIETEQIARVGRRFYILLRAQPGPAQYTEKQLFLGPCLTESRETHYADYLDWQEKVIAQKRAEEGREQLKWIKEEILRVGDGRNDRGADQ